MPEPVRRCAGLSATRLRHRDTTGFLYEIGLVKRYKRTGWSLAGVPSPESVADRRGHRAESLSWLERAKQAAAGNS
jgi:5'-deoxynucleotidase YfbR-like HD superfamily hydrolase